MRISTGILGTERQLAFELIRQLEIVTIRDPGLAEYAGRQVGGTQWKLGAIKQCIVTGFWNVRRRQRYDR